MKENELKKAIYERYITPTKRQKTEAVGLEFELPVESERYRMLLHHLTSYTKYGRQILFHDCPNFGLFSCASQIQLDVEEKDLAEGKTLDDYIVEYGRL